MQIQVEVVSVTETNMGKYKKLEVAFRQDGKVAGKNLVSYVHPEVYEAAKGFKPGEVHNVTLAKEAAKDGKEYWQWVAVEGAGVPATEATPTADKPKTVSNYETKEERAVRQQYIIRQSALDRSIDFWNMHNKKATPEEVFEIAGKFVDWVNNVEGK